MGLFSIKKIEEEPIEKIELKGIVLGSHYEGDKKIITSLGGISGSLFIETFDNLVYQLSWFPSKDGVGVLTISYSDINTILSGLNTKFNIHLSPDDIDDIDKPECNYKASKGKYRFLAFVEDDEVKNKFSLLIWDNELYARKQKSKDEEVSGDF